MTAEDRPAICRYNPVHPDYRRAVLMGEISDHFRCTKRFRRKSDCSRHERIHTNHRSVTGSSKTFKSPAYCRFPNRPFVCPLPACGKRFIQKSALTVHMRIQCVSFDFSCIAIRRADPGSIHELARVNVLIHVCYAAKPSPTLPPWPDIARFTVVVDHTSARSLSAVKG